MTARPGALRNPALVHRAARAVCPAPERPWVDAMFAELDAVEGPARGAWALGALSIVWSVITLRAGALVPAPMWWGIVAALHAVVAFAIGSRTDIEALWVDDDVCLRLAWLSGALLIGLGALAINRIFSQANALPRNRR